MASDMFGVITSIKRRPKQKGEHVYQPSIGVANL
jgi:hypothetical protein